MLWERWGGYAAWYAVATFYFLCHSSIPALSCDPPLSSVGVGQWCRCWCWCWCWCHWHWCSSSLSCAACTHSPHPRATVMGVGQSVWHDRMGTPLYGPPCVPLCPPCVSLRGVGVQSSPHRPPCLQGLAAVGKGRRLDVRAISGLKCYC
jgi:hypothetical protein